MEMPERPESRTKTAAELMAEFRVPIPDFYQENEDLIEAIADNAYRLGNTPPESMLQQLISNLRQAHIDESQRLAIVALCNGDLLDKEEMKEFIHWRLSAPDRTERDLLIGTELLWTECEAQEQRELRALQAARSVLEKGHEHAGVLTAVYARKIAALFGDPRDVKKALHQTTGWSIFHQMDIASKASYNLPPDKGLSLLNKMLSHSEAAQYPEMSKIIVRASHCAMRVIETSEDDTKALHALEKLESHIESLREQHDSYQLAVGLLYFGFALYLFEEDGRAEKVLLESLTMAKEQRNDTLISQIQPILTELYLD